MVAKAFGEHPDFRPKTVDVPVPSCHCGVIAAVSAVGIGSPLAFSEFVTS